MKRLIIALLMLVAFQASAQTLSGSLRDFSYPPIRLQITKASWTNAQVVALGASLTGDITMMSLPAKAVVLNAYMIVDTACTGTASLTASLGRTGATYVDYLGAGDVQASANTVYGDAVGERGANLTGYDLPSVTAATNIVAHFISTVNNLSAATTCTGSVYIVWEQLP